MTVVERRQTARRTPAAQEPISQLRLRTGHVLTVINIGDHGALVQGRTCLQPGTRVDVQVITPDARLPIGSEVLRARVSRVAADSIVYETALRFNAVVDTRPGYPIPASAPAPRNDAGTTYPRVATWLKPGQARNPAAR